MGKVDWQKVVDLGALGTYYVNSVPIKKSPNSAAAKLEAEKKAAKEMLKAAAEAKKFQVSPGEWAMKITRAELQS